MLFLDARAALTTMRATRTRAVEYKAPLYASASEGFAAPSPAVDFEIGDY